MKLKQSVIVLYSFICTILCLFLLSELKDKEGQLQEETEMKYEYSIMIDSLINEKNDFVK